MLSYRHAFHAGNFADLLKHLALSDVLHYMQHKDKPFDYIDTHAGAGSYALDDRMVDKNREFESGIGPWLNLPLDEAPPALRPILSLTRDTVDNVVRYPGSPQIAASYLREQDRAFLFEMHHQDAQSLRGMCADDPRIRVDQSDGYAGLIRLLPRRSRRAVVLIDPSYEIKTDYRLAVEAVLAAHRRMANAIFLLWYPVVSRARVREMERALVGSGIPRIQRFEMGISADSQGLGMTGAGVFVINPPYQMKARLGTCLAPLARKLSRDGKLHLDLRELASE